MKQEQVLRQRIVEEALRWKDTPYVHQRRQVGAVDCIGLVICVGREAGALIWNEDDPRWQEFKNYSFIADFEAMHRGLKIFMGQLNRKEASPGDVIWIRDQGVARHLGIVVSERSYVHAFRGANKVLEHPFTLRSRKYIRSAFRFPLLQEVING